jgi:hypothetical protein
MTQQEFTENGVGKRILRIISTDQLNAMRHFLATIFYDLPDALQTCKKDAAEKRAVGESHLFVLRSPDGDGVHSYFDKIADMCERTGYAFSAMKARSIFQALTKEEMTFDQLDAAVDELGIRVRDEMSICGYFVVPKEDYGAFFEPFPFGRDVTDRFPKIMLDAREANQCLVLERSTACVFHLMRIWEYCTREYGKFLNVRPMRSGKKIPIDEAGFDQILTLVENKLTEKNSRISRANKHKWIRPLKFLLAIKESRNETMHPGQMYTLSDAQGLYDLTKNYLTTLASIL